MYLSKLSNTDGVNIIDEFNMICYPSFNIINCQSHQYYWWIITEVLIISVQIFLQISVNVLNPWSRQHYRSFIVSNLPIECAFNHNNITIPLSSSVDIWKALFQVPLWKHPQAVPLCQFSLIFFLLVDFLSKPYGLRSKILAERIKFWCKSIRPTTLR